MLKKRNPIEKLSLPSECVHTLFCHQVLKTPEDPAVIDAERTVTFRELDEGSNRLAHHLLNGGIQTGDIVGIYLPRSWEMISAMLAVLKAGGGCLLLDPRLPPERLATVLADARPVCIVTNDGKLPVSLSGNSRVMDLYRQREEILRCSNHESTRAVPISSLAYVIYTSGSTGKPKGVAMPHRTLANLINWEIARRSDAKARTLQYAAIGFGVSFQEIFSTLCSGGALVIVGENIRGDAVALIRYIHEQKIERLFVPYSVLRHIAEAAEVTGVVPESLRDIISAGEPLHVGRSIREFFLKLPNCVLENQYGASETLIVTSYCLEGAVDVWSEHPPIGRPIPNARIYILDEGGEPLSTGQIGEIHIGGAVLADGYLNRPDMTASRFVPANFPAGSGERLYKTGDLGKTWPDGTIQYAGRKDDQVKIRGFRVEPTEVVAHLKKNPAVRDAVVLPFGDEDQGRRLVAYVVSDGDRSLSRDNLRAQLLSTLPEYMVPSEFVSLAELPLLPSGKVDRSALASIGRLKREQDAGFLAPRTVTEVLVAKVFSEVLGLPPVSANDTFFALGGESLTAMRVMLELSKQFRTEFSVGLLFENPSVCGLSSTIERILGQRPILK